MVNFIGSSGSSCSIVYDHLSHSKDPLPENVTEGEGQESLAGSEENAVSNKLIIKELRQNNVNEIHNEIRVTNEKLKAELQRIVSLPKTEVYQIARSFEGVNQDNAEQLVPKERREIAQDLIKLLMLRKITNECFVERKGSLDRAHFAQHRVHLITVAQGVNEQRSLLDNEVMRLFGQIDEKSKKVCKEVSRQRAQRGKRKRGYTNDVYGKLASEIQAVQTGVLPDFFKKQKAYSPHAKGTDEEDEEADLLNLN